MAKDKERVYKVGLADPRSGKERLAGLVNRALSGNRKSPGRAYDDSPSQMAKKRSASKGGKSKKR